MNKAFDYQPVFLKTVLESGLRIVTEHHPNTRTVCAGIFIETGTRDESPKETGVAHFLEHMVFKGTQKRSAFEIAQSLEAVGGDLNAYTSREYTCYHTTSLREHLMLSLEVICDLVQGAKLDPEEIKKERNVILQEIDMSKDVLEEYIFDVFFEKAYRGHPLAKSILGTKSSLRWIGHEELSRFYQNDYCASRMIVSVAGSVDHDEVVKSVKSLLSFRKRSSKKHHRQPTTPRSFVKIENRKSEQSHILLSYPSCSFREEHRFDSYIVNAVLGGGMTSRLYQKLREEHGFAYTVYSYLQSFTDSGVLMIYAGTSMQNLAKSVHLLLNELEEFCASGVSEKELEFFKTQVKGSILISSDDVENRMTSIAVNEMVFGKYKRVEDVVDEVEKVSLSSLRKYIDTYFKDQSPGILIMGQTPKGLDKALRAGG